MLSLAQFFCNLHAPLCLLMFVSYTSRPVSEGDSASRRIFGKISNAGAVPMHEKTILLQESFTWRHVSEAASIPSDFLVHGEETARPFCLALSLVPLSSLLHLAVLINPGWKIEGIKLIANLGRCS